MQLHVDQYPTRLQECLGRKEMTTENGHRGQCPLCNQTCENLPEHCQTCFNGHDNDDNERQAGAISVHHVIVDRHSIF